MPDQRQSNRMRCQLSIGHDVIKSKPDQKNDKTFSFKNTGSRNGDRKCGGVGTRRREIQTESISVHQKKKQMKNTHAPDTLVVVPVNQMVIERAIKIFF